MGERAAGRPNRYFSFLRRLRAGGRSNMYGAIPYLSAAFGCDREEAFRIVCEWIDSQAETRESAGVPVPRRSAPSPVVIEAEPTLFDQRPEEPAVAVPCRAVSGTTRRPAATTASRSKAGRRS